MRLTHLPSTLVIPCLWKFLILHGALFMSLLCLGPSQAQTLKGRVLDAQSLKGIPYASLQICQSRQGSICNQDGDFEFSLKGMTFPLQIEVACIGYRSRIIAIESPSSTALDTIQLQPAVLSLEAVQIIATDIEPRQLLMKALREVDKNFSRQDYLLKTFYRHYCKDDGVYGRMIEASVDVYASKGHRWRQRQVSNKYEFAVKQLRKSLDFTDYSYFNHLPIALSRSLSRDYNGLQIPYLRGQLAEKAKYRYSDTLLHKSQSLLVVQVQTPYRGNDYLTDFYVNLEHMAIEKIEEHESASYLDRGRKVLRHNHYLIRYRREGDLYFLSHIINEGSVQSWEKKSGGGYKKSRNHSHRVSWVVKQAMTQGFQPFKGAEPDAEDLGKMPYNPDFWENYAVLASTPLENRIRRDLNQRLELEKQFEKGSKLEENREWQEALAWKEHEKFLHHYQGELKVICFWKSGDRPGLGEILTLRKLSKNFEDLPFGFLWVNLDDSKDEMRDEIEKYGLYIGSHVHSPAALQGKIALHYQVGEHPYLLLLGPEGKVLFRGKDLPKYKRIEQMAKEIGIIAGD